MTTLVGKLMQHSNIATTMDAYVPEAKERPILFSAPMVRALLEGRKTQTRRIMKPHPEWDACVNGVNYCGPMAFPIVNPVGHQCGHPIFTDGRTPGATLCRNPYGKPGDRLWVRELHWRWGKWAKNGLTKSGRTKWKFVPVGTSIRYAENAPKTTAKRDGECGWVYRHARFMFRAHSRITQQVTEVRVQRLQEISEEDAKAEGAEWYGVADLKPNGDAWGGESIAYRAGFHDLWQSINGEENYQSNPWVWAITFKAVA